MWIPDAEEVWKSAELIKDYKNGDTSLQLMLEDGTVRIIRVESEKNLSPSIFVAFCFSLWFCCLTLWAIGFIISTQMGL